MDFSLSPEQLALVRMARDLAKRYQPDPRVSWEDAEAFPWEFIRELARQGLTGILVPESKGGQGQSLLDAVLVIHAVASTAPRLGDAVQATLLTD